MERIKLLIILCLTLFLIIGCSNSTKTKKSDDNYTVTQAEKDGNVVIQNLSNSFGEIAQGAVKNKNLDKAFSFIGSVNNGNESQIKVSIFNKDGKSFTNKLTYDGKKITFENNYGGYQLPPGNYQCQSISPRNAIFYLESCKNEKGKDFTTVIAIISNDQAFKDAEQQADKK